MCNCDLCAYFKTTEVLGETICYCELVGVVFNKKLEDIEFDIPLCYEYQCDTDVQEAV